MLEDELFERLLSEHQQEIRTLVQRFAPRGLLAMEAPEDLVQEVSAHVLRQRVMYGEMEDGGFAGWLRQVTLNVLRGRHEHYRALKRSGARVIRLALESEPEEGLGWLRDLTASMTGPSTLAARREQLLTAARALDALLRRDRWLIEGICEGRSPTDDAAALGVQPESVGQARRRALERLRSAFRVVAMGLDPRL